MSKDLTDDDLINMALIDAGTPPEPAESAPTSSAEHPPQQEHPVEPGFPAELVEDFALPEGAFPDDQEPGQDPSPFEPPEAPISPVLGLLDVTRRPQPRTVCEGCRNSVWFSSPTEVKCYCRVMYLVSWSTKEPNVLTGCDGMFLGEE